MPTRTKVSEPNLTFCVEVPEAPKTMGKVGKEEWNRICKALLDNQNLAVLYLPFIERVCRLLDKQAFIETKYMDLMEKNMLIRQGRAAHPYFKMYATLELQIAKCMSELGMTPKSRKNGNLPISGNLGNPLANPKNKTAQRPRNLDDGFEPIAFPLKQAASG